MVMFDLEENTPLTNEERMQLSEARKLPIIYDEDSPSLTEDMEKAFIAARKVKPYRGEPLTLYVSPSTIEKIRKMGADYIAILGKLLDKAVDEYHAV